MTVLYLINGLGTGGAERSLAEMVPLLAENGVDVRVRCLTRKKEGVGVTDAVRSFDVQYLSARGKLGQVRELRAMLRELKPDVLHTTIAAANFVGRAAAVGLPVKVLTSIVSMPYSEEKMANPRLDSRKVSIIQAADAWTSRHFTSGFHAISEATKTAAVRDLGIDPARVRVVRRGRDPKRLGEPSPERTRAARVSLGIEDGAMVFLNVARQEFPKGQDVLIRAFGTVARTHPQALLLIAGRKGQATPAVQAALQSIGDAAEQVRMLGHRDDVPELLAAADVFVFPSRFEGLGGAVLEAMAMGLPVIASDIPALRESTRPGETADLVAAGDDAALAHAMVALATDDGRLTRYGHVARRVFLDRFQLRAVVSEMADLYRDLAADRFPPPSHSTSVSS